MTDKDIKSISHVCTQCLKDCSKQLIRHFLSYNISGDAVSNEKPPECSYLPASFFLTI